MAARRRAPVFRVARIARSRDRALFWPGDESTILPIKK
ncbi:hypothetical protein C7S16_5356 [Burkholderia thailandensis]|uniref:Uncharacterized protein n=1 Tax=Burkholderia thailandensis TaxID=57975 RepID=A0AAW9CTC6_BURTH|nr:hypothetical protein [Burkholderia thailandensis]